MNILKAKTVGISFAMAAEVAGQLDVLRVKAEESGCEQIADLFRAAGDFVTEAGRELMDEIQRLSGEHCTAATDAAIAKVTA